MKVLFAISIVCFAGILWAALALARRIKAALLRADSAALAPAAVASTAPAPVPVPVPAPPQPDFKHHLFLAPDSGAGSGSERVAATVSITGRRARQGSLQQSVREITANKQWVLPPRPVRLERLFQRVESPQPGMRKPPQPARHGPVERLDRAYFNKDLGDLNDPYQPPTRLRGNDRKQ